MWQLLSRNQSTNTEVWFKEEGDNVKVHTCRISDSPAIALYKDNQKQKDKNIRYGDGAVAARIDPYTMNTLMLSGAAEDADYMKKFLNNGDNSHMRTTKGKI